MDHPGDKSPQETGDQEANASRSPEYPIPPDLARVKKLRRRLKQSRRDHQPRKRIFNRDAARRARELGAYTLIPMLMIAGPVVGYFLGVLIQKRWGGEPWPAVAGSLFGLVAAFRQIYLILAKKSGSR